MEGNRALIALAVIVVAAVAISAYVINSSVLALKSTLNSNSQATGLVSLSTTLLAGQTIPAGGYIELMDISPEQLVTGHMAVHLPCYLNGTSPLVVLVGSVPQLTREVLNKTNTISAVSQPGGVCFYHFLLLGRAGVAAMGMNNTVMPGMSSITSNSEITDLQIANPTANSILLPPTSSVTIAVESLSPA